MRRREFITLLGGATASWPLDSRAQQPGQLRRIGVLMPFAASNPVYQVRIAAFLQGLEKLGRVDGRNVRIEYRASDGGTEEIRKYAAEQGVSEEEALKRGMDEKSKEFVEKGAEVYTKV